MDRRLGDAAELLERLLGADGAWADVFTERSVHVRAGLAQRLRGGRLDPPRREAHRTAVSGTGLRVIDGGDVRFRALADDDPASLRAAAGDLGRGAPHPIGPLPLAHRDAPPESPGDAERDAWLERAADAAFGLDEAVAAVDVSFRAHRRRVFVAGAGRDEPGLAARTASLHLALRVDVALLGPDGRVEAYAVHGAPGLDAFLARTPEDVAREAVLRARRLAGARTLPPADYPVVVGPGWGGVWMHEAVGHALEADVYRAAPIAEPGARIAPPGVSFTDDPTLPGGRGTCAYDDEAGAAQPVRLIDDGRLGAPLADRRHGAPTGHGRRQDYRHAPLPRSANLVLAPGTARPKALLDGIADGLYVAAVRGGWARPETDRFGFEVVEGRRIERGRLTTPVAGVFVEGGLRAALRGIEAVADDLRLDAARGLCRKGGQVVPVSVAAPSVRFRSLAVTPRMER